MGRTRLLIATSVTRYWNKKLPKILPKAVRKSSNYSFRLKSHAVLNSQKVTKCDYFEKKIVAKTFKNSPIWSHCPLLSKKESGLGYKFPSLETGN